MLVAPTNILTADISTSATTILTKYNNMVPSDRIYMQADGKVEFMAISTGPTGSGPYTYTVVRNLDGSGGNLWYAGDAILNTGHTGDGFIDIYSVRGVKAGTEIGPTIVGNVRNSVTYSDWSPRWAIGNLDGLYGYSGTEYGAAFGVPSAAWVKIDPTNGIRIGHNATTKISLDASGNAAFSGTVTAAAGTIGGFTLSSTTLSATSLTFTAGAANTARIEAGTGANLGGIDSANGAADWVFWAGDTHANRAAADFRVGAQGLVYAGAIRASGSSGDLTIGTTSGVSGADLYLHGEDSIDLRHGRDDQAAVRLERGFTASDRRHAAGGTEHSSVHADSRQGHHRWRPGL